MQPEATATSHTDQSHNATRNTTSLSTQHGLDDRSGTASHLPIRDGSGDESRSLSGESDVSSSPSSSFGSTTDERLPRLRLSESPPRPRSSVARIFEYENALSPSPRKSSPEGPAFKIVQGKRKSAGARSPIAEFPNELLTHILSHLPPSSLSTVALVSHRFHDLVTTPHAWRTAFSRYFPGSDALLISDRSRPVSSQNDSVNANNQNERGGYLPEKRVFTRLTALASWRSEYILRTRLLRSLARGKPVPITQGHGQSASPRHGSHNSGSAMITYNSQLLTTVNHIHATFNNSESKKRSPRFIHAADESGSSSVSDASAGKVDNWGFSDPQMFLQFADRFPGEAQWGLGAGDVVGLPNFMDVSQPYGVLSGEGTPGGLLYYRSTEEMRGRFLAFSLGISAPEYGIPLIQEASETMCCAWIAKSRNVPSVSEGLVGIMSGSSKGVVSSYSLGADGLREQRLDRGELTARWVLSPGVPIIGIAVDDDYSTQRRSQQRVWAVAINALGEAFYLTDVPARRQTTKGNRPDEESRERAAWETGRSVAWKLAEPTRRVARIDPYQTSAVDGSYSPKSSSDAMGLSQDQVIAETREIEKFLNMKPKDFQSRCLGWDMRRKLEIDFAGDDGYVAGEAIVVISCGLDEGASPSIRRFTRCRATNIGSRRGTILQHEEATTPIHQGPSIFGGGTPRSGIFIGSQAVPEENEEWRMSDLSLGGFKAAEISATAVDNSKYATSTVSEDALLKLSGRSTTTSPFGTPMLGTRSPSGAEIPGQRARLLAVGTKTGAILLWNMRSPTSNTADLTNLLSPIRVIYTDSPEISCLALSGLYLVHGGNDGLVQAWDPLASSLQPIRTLHSRFSSRARRRLMQAQASIQGVGFNLYAAGAICLDPDPTVLRGMVSLGTHLRYWSYSSSAADQYASRKRRLRRSDRGSNNGGEVRFSGSGRGAIQDFIAVEKLEMEHEDHRRRREAERLAGRFGTDLLGAGAGDEEMLAYARLLSEEAFEKDQQRRKGEPGGGFTTDDSSVLSADPRTPEASVAGGASTPSTPVPSQPDEEVDNDLAEAIRLSLLNDQTSPTSQASGFSNVSVKFKKGKKPPAGPRSNGSTPAGSSTQAEADDLDFAIQLSMAEEQSRKETEDDFPVLEDTASSWRGQGKGKRRVS